MTKGELRRLWFQVHKWIGLILFVVLIPLSLSGSVLLAHDWLEEEEGEEAPALSLPLSHYVEAARAALPAGARIASVAMPSEESPAVTVRATPPGSTGEGRNPATLSVSLDPGTARVVPAGDDDDFFEGTLHRFHGSLLIPGLGRPIVGWLGVAMLISSLSGIWLWWPTIGSMKRAFRWRRGNDWDFNLHHQVGFWIALPLAALSLTGAWISFPMFFSSIVGETPPARMAPRGGRLPVASPRLSVDAVLATIKSNAGVRQINFPSGDTARWRIQVGGDERRKMLAVDDATGRLLPPDPPRGGPIMRAMRAVHDGDEDTGPVWRALAVLGGAAPAILGVTGVTMWLRSRGWRARVAANRKASAPQG